MQKATEYLTRLEKRPTQGRMIMTFQKYEYEVDILKVFREKKTKQVTCKDLDEE